MCKARARALSGDRARRLTNHGTRSDTTRIQVRLSITYGRAEEVLARIESRGQRDGDEIDLHERCLELFKVVSKNGTPEVWLLG